MINTIIKYKYLALFAPILITILLAIGLKNLAFTNDYHMFFSEDNPQLVAFDNLQDTYNKTDNIIIALRDSKNGILNQQNLLAISNITEQAWQTPFSTRVDSITNYQHTYANGDELIVVDLFDTENNEIDINNISQIATSEALLKNRLITDKKDTTGINITINLPTDEKQAAIAQTDAVKFARTLRNKIKADYPQFEIWLSGVIMLNNAFPEMGESDLKSLVPLSFIMVFVLLMLILRNIKMVVGALLIMVFTVIASMGIAGYMMLPVTPPMTSIPVIMLTIAVAGSVHLMMSFKKHMQIGDNKNTALINAFNHNKKAITIAGVTTAIGFLGLNFSEVPPFHDLGNIAAIGTIISLVLILIFLPAWIMVLPIKFKPKENIIKNDWSLKFADFIINYKTKILVISSLVAVIFIALIPLNTINDNFVEYFDERVEFRRDADNIDKNLTGIGGIDYSFSSGKENGIADPKFLADVEKFVTMARETQKVNNVLSLTDTFKKLNQNMHGDDINYYQLPERKELASQYLLLYEMSLPYGLDLNNQINIDKSAIRVAVNMENSSSKDYLLLEQKFDQWLRKNTPDILTMGASPAIMFAHIGIRNVNAMIIGTFFTLIAISLMLVFLLKSLKIGIISLVPNLVPIATAFGLWALTSGQITMSLSVVASITLGIIVDDTVHFLNKFNHAIRDLGKSAADSVRYAFYHVGDALVISSIALSAGFMVLINSAFEINSGMGELTSYIIIIALIMDFLLLPSLLLILYGNKNQKEKI